MKNATTINIGGINGSGEASVDTQNQDFQDLKAMIKTLSSQQVEAQKMENEFLSIRFQMESYLFNEESRMVLAGEFIEKFLKVIDVKKKDFAAYVEYDESNLSALLKGRRKINSDLAIKFGRIFNVNPVTWLNIESKNELIRAVNQQVENYEKYSLQSLLLKAG